MSDADRLQQYVQAWEVAVTDVVALLRGLAPEEWEAPTDLAGWNVRAVAAHLAHLEAELAGDEQDPVEVPELDHITSLMGVYTEMGPLARRDWPTEEIVDELESSAAKRLAELRAAMPTDPKGSPPITPGGIGWSWETLLSNRPLDVWMHEQDIRRAVDRPGGLDTLPARHVLGVFLRGLPFVVGKRVGPPAGTTVVLDVTGPIPAQTAVVMDSEGRGNRLQGNPDDPTVTLRMDLESYVILSGGRRDPSDVPVEIEGDHELGALIVSALAVTP